MEANNMIAMAPAVEILHSVISAGDDGLQPYWPALELPVNKGRMIFDQHISSDISWDGS